MNPYILTAAIETNSFTFFNNLRKKHFPPERNFINAHLTLFHALPPEKNIIDLVKDISQTQKTFTLNVSEPVSIGKGVAFKIESSELQQLHKSLQSKWWDFLSLQDRQKLWPHITIQNKVSVDEARNLLSELKNNFTPFNLHAIGLHLWEYLNGPWRIVEEFTFKNLEP